MLQNCEYDKVKLLHELSKVIWFIEKHAKPNALKDNDADYLKVVESLKKDLERQIGAIRELE